MGLNWTKPPAGTGIDWGNPLAQGMALLLPFAEGSGPPGDVASGSAWSLAGATGTPSWAATPAGAGFSFVAANTQYLAGPRLSALGVLNTEWTVAWSGALGSVSGTNVVIDGSNDNNGLILHVDGGGLTIRNGGYSFVGLGYTADTAWHSYVLSYISGTASLWVDGAPYAPVSAGTIDWTANPARVGASATTPTWAYGGTLGYFMAWRRALPAAQAVDACANPWQLFRSPRPLWTLTVPAVAAASPPHPFPGMPEAILAL